MTFKTVLRGLLCTGLALGALGCDPEVPEEGGNEDAGVLIDGGGGGGIGGGEGGAGGGVGGEGGIGGEGGEGGVGGEGGEGGIGGIGGEGGIGGAGGGEGGMGGAGGGQPAECDALAMGACTARGDCEWTGDHCRTNFEEIPCDGLQPGDCVMRDDCAWSREADACVEAPEGDCNGLDIAQCDLRPDCQVEEVDCAGVDCGEGAVCVPADVGPRICEDIGGEEIGDRAACDAAPGCAVQEAPCACEAPEPCNCGGDADGDCACEEPPPCECAWACGPEAQICENIQDADACLAAGCDLQDVACECGGARPAPCECPPGEPCDCAELVPDPCECPVSCVTPNQGGDCGNLDQANCMRQDACLWNRGDGGGACACFIDPDGNELCDCDEDPIDGGWCEPAPVRDCADFDMNACNADPACAWFGFDGVPGAEAPIVAQPCECIIDADGIEVCDCGEAPAPPMGFCGPAQPQDCGALDEAACADRADCDWDMMAARRIAPPPPCDCFIDDAGQEICDCGGDVPVEPAGICVPAEPRVCGDLSPAECNNAQGCMWEALEDIDGPCVCEVGPNGEEICACDPIGGGQCVPVRPQGCDALAPDACDAAPGCELEWLPVPCPPCAPDMDECPICEPVPVCRPVQMQACEAYGENAEACSADPACQPVRNEICADPAPCPPGEDCGGNGFVAPDCWVELSCAPLDPQEDACGIYEDEAACGADPECVFMDRELCAMPDIACDPNDPNCALPPPVCEDVGVCVAAEAACWGLDEQACMANDACAFNADGGGACGCEIDEQGNELCWCDEPVAACHPAGAVGGGEMLPPPAP